MTLQFHLLENLLVVSNSCFSISNMMGGASYDCTTHIFWDIIARSGTLPPFPSWGLCPPSPGVFS